MGLAIPLADGAKEAVFWLNVVMLERVSHSSECLVHVQNSASLRVLRTKKGLDDLFPISEAAQLAVDKALWLAYQVARHVSSTCV